MTYSEIIDMVIDSLSIAFLLTIASMIVISVVKYYRKDNWSHPLRTLFFLMYGFVLLYITVFRGGLFQNETHAINCIPFDELLSASYYQSIVNGTANGMILLAYNVIGNIVWFIPYGMLLCNYLKLVTWQSVCIGCFLFSLTIEILQYLFYTGISDIDDIIFNVIGGMLGFFIIDKIRRKRRMKCQ